MILSYRPADVKEVSGCYGLLPDNFVCAPELRERLPYIWRDAMLRGEMTIDVVEDASRSIDDPMRLLAFTASAFIGDATLSVMKSPAAEPYPAATAACNWLRGSSPFLTMPQIGKGNAGAGLALFVVHQGLTASLDGIRERTQVQIKATESLVSSYKGYNLRCIVQEVYGQDAVQRSIGFGAHVINDFNHYGATRGNCFIPGRFRPYLVGATRERVVPGSSAETLFYNSEPRVRFTSAEQAVLRLALTNRTDEEIADAVCISVAAVHKRWIGLYDRVLVQAADVFAGKEETVLPMRGRRGLEKRRILLNYLRHHPEELRPIDPG